MVRAEEQLQLACLHCICQADLRAVLYNILDYWQLAGCRHHGTCTPPMHVTNTLLCRMKASPWS